MCWQCRAWTLKRVMRRCLLWPLASFPTSPQALRQARLCLLRLELKRRETLTTSRPRIEGHSHAGSKCKCLRVRHQTQKPATLPLAWAGSSSQERVAEDVSGSFLLWSCHLQAVSLASTPLLYCILLWMVSAADVNQVILAGGIAMSMLCRPEHTVAAVCQDDLAAFATDFICNNQRQPSVKQQRDS